MKKIKFIEIAASLGVAVPACLIGMAQECEASVVKSHIPEIKIELGRTQLKTNPVKDRIVDMLQVNKEDSNYQQLAHTDVHADYTISHTDVHTDYSVGNHYVDHHSNTPSKYVDHHSNSLV